MLDFPNKAIKSKGNWYIFLMMHVPLAALLAALLLRTTAIFKFSRGLMNRLTTRVLLNNNVLIAHVNVFSAKDPARFRCRYI